MTGKGTAVVTVCTSNYLHFGRALVKSVRAADPAIEPFLCLVDRPDWNFQPSEEPATVLFADELGVPNWRRFAFQYQVLELTCAIKSAALSRLLDLGYERAIYLDADIQVYGSFDTLQSRLDDSSIVLTPHLVSPSSSSGGTEGETAVLSSGIYNMGFLALRSSPPTDAFLRWWSTKLRRDCICDRAQHRYADQRWMDFVPGMFEGVRIERDPGWNVGHWNLAERSVTQSPQGEYKVGDRPLFFFHFSGINPTRREELSRHSNNGFDTEVLRELVGGYIEVLGDCGSEQVSGHGYEFGRLRDGTPIQDAWREAVRTDQPELEGITDPFDTLATPDLLKRLRAAQRRTQQLPLEARLNVVRFVERNSVLGPLLRLAVRLRS